MMELNELKSVWKHPEAGSKNNEELRQMLVQAKIPVLRQIQRQTIVESFALGVFLVCYYSMFDGQQKTLMVNLLLVAVGIMTIVHSIYGYILVNTPDGKSCNLLASLQRREKQIRYFALLSVALRTVFAIALIIFFTENPVLNTARSIALIFVILVFALQMTMIMQIWIGRLKKIRKIIEDFNTLR